MVLDDLAGNVYFRLDHIVSFFLVFLLLASSLREKKKKRNDGANKY